MNIKWKCSLGFLVVTFFASVVYCGEHISYTDQNTDVRYHEDSIPPSAPTGVRIVEHKPAAENFNIIPPDLAREKGGIMKSLVIDD